METLESLKAKLDSVADINSVVRTMKAVAASNIGQYERSVSALAEYYQIITMGLAAYFRAEKWKGAGAVAPVVEFNSAAVLVFGSDQGLVGGFNDSLSKFIAQDRKNIP